MGEGMTPRVPEANGDDVTTTNDGSAQLALARKVYYDCPAVAGISGPPGLGKTVDCLYSFPRALFIAAPGALKPAVSIVGYVPPEVRVAEDLQGIMAVFTEILRQKKRTFSAVVVDDFGAAVSASELKAMETTRDGRLLYKNLTLMTRRLIEQFRDTGVHTVLSTHKKEAKPATPESQGHAGGPALPGALMTVVPALSDLWVNMFADAMRQPHPVSYAAGFGLQGGQGTRDRHGVCGDRSPANLAELLRQAGYKIERPPGMEWQEDAIETLASAVVAKTQTLSDTARYAVQKLKEQGSAGWQIRWFLRDLADRVEIRETLAARNANAFSFLGVTI